MLKKTLKTVFIIEIRLLSTSTTTTNIYLINKYYFDNDLIYK